MHSSLSAFILVEGELSRQCGEIAHWSRTALREKNSSSRLSHDSTDLSKEHTRGQFEKLLQTLDQWSIHTSHSYVVPTSPTPNVYSGECWNSFSWRFWWEYMNVSSEEDCMTMGWLMRVIHVSQFLEAWSPVIKVVIVLVLIRVRGGKGAQAACQRAISFIVVDQSCVKWRHVGVVVCNIQALQREERKGSVTAIIMISHANCSHKNNKKRN